MSGRRREPPCPGSATLRRATGCRGRLYIGGRKASEIVDVGLYSITRNPLYLFSSAAAAGVGAQAGSVVLAAVFFIGCALAFRVVIRREERHLAETFREPYRSYMRRVPRFRPSVGLFRDRSTLFVATDRVDRTFKDGLVFLVAKPAFEFVEHLQNDGALPTVPTVLLSVGRRKKSGRRAGRRARR